MKVACCIWRKIWFTVAKSDSRLRFVYVTLIRVDNCKQVKQQYNNLIKQKMFRLTRNGLRVFCLINLKVEFGSLHIEHPVIVVDKIEY